MYLHELRIVNDGPIEDLAMNFAFQDSGLPKPLIVVGENGSGKTNFLSIVADALVEGAAQHHSDVVAPSPGSARHFLRLVGGTNLRRGTKGGFALLRFLDNGEEFIYAQKAGTYPPASLPDDLSPCLQPGATWAPEGGSKNFGISEQQSRRIFRSGSYSYFPASRSERPHWLNQESLSRASAFTPKVRIDGRLGKQMYVENGLSAVAEWLPGLILDSRPHVRPATDGEFGTAQWRIDDTSFQVFKSTLAKADRILQIVLADPGARFVWRNRFEGLQLETTSVSGTLPLDALSSGQATLLSVFETLLMHGDATGGPTEGAEGICVIDEIDAHVHIDLAYRAIPALMSEFQHIQFILSAHSPLFVLGAEDHYGADGVQIVEMPSGNAVPAEGYREFKNALTVLKDTRGFDSEVTLRVSAQQTPLILCEGKTDPDYLRTAATLLGRSGSIEGAELDWIGSMEPSGARGSGKDALERAWRLLKANPSLQSRPVLMLFDNDVRLQAADSGRVSIRVAPSNLDNKRMKKGIENLLNEQVFEERFWSETTRDYGNGKVNTDKNLDKAKLCEYLCTEKRDPADFHGFGPLLSIVEEWLTAKRAAPPAAE